MSAYEWSKLEAQGTAPSPRHGHSFSLVGDVAVVFGGAHGGVDDAAPQFFNDMYTINLSASPLVWKKVTQKGAVPKAREGHSCSIVGKFLFLFAGTGEGEVCFNDFHVFDLAAETWAPIKATGTAPSKRNNHAACVLNSKIYIFGGFLDGVAGNDVHCFDPKASAWLPLKQQGKPPVPRCDHTWVAVGSKLVVFGGAGDSVWYNDVHIFSPDTATWSSPQAKGTPPGERDYHAALALDDKTMLVFGGANDSDNWRHYNDVNFFDVPTSTWSTPKTQGTAPSVRWGHAAVLHGGKMYSFGGTSEDKFFNDLWVLAPAKEADQPVKPPRGTLSGQSPVPLPKKDGSSAASPTAASSSASSSGSSGGALEAPTPIPSKRTVYTLPTTVPAQRITVAPGTPGKVAPRDVSGAKGQVMGFIDSIFNEIQKEYLEVDQDRATLNAERAAFEEEKKVNQALFEKQQRELSALIEQHKEENTALLKSRQAQYDEKLEEIRQRQEALRANEERFKQTLMEFDANKKKMEAVMAQFASFKT